MLVTNFFAQDIRDVQQIVVVLLVQLTATAAAQWEQANADAKRWMTLHDQNLKRKRNDIAKIDMKREMSIKRCIEVIELSK